MASSPEARAILRADNSKLRRDLRKARRLFSRTFGRVASRIRGTLSKALSPLASPLGVAGAGAGIALAAKDVFGFERQLTRLGIQAGKTPRQLNEFRAAIDDISVRTGVARKELLGGAAAFVSLVGESGFSVKTLETFARVAQASGADMQDLAGVALSLQENLKIDPKDFEKAFSIILHAGKAGSVELKEMASLLTTIAPTFSKFGDNAEFGTDALASMAAGLQFLRKEFGSASEATTGFSGLMVGLTKHAKEFEAAGVNIFDVGPDGVKRYRDLSAIIDDIAASRLAKDPTLLTKAFGRDEARKAFDALSGYRQQWRALSAESLAANDVASDYTTFMESSSGRMDKAMSKIKVAIANAFTPEVIELFVSAATKGAELIERIAKSLGYIRELYDDLSQESLKELGKKDPLAEEEIRLRQKLKNAPGDAARFYIEGRLKEIGDIKRVQQLDELDALARNSRGSAREVFTRQGERLFNETSPDLREQSTFRPSAPFSAQTRAVSRGIRVVLSVDEQGLVRARQREDNRARRSPQ